MRNNVQRKVSPVSGIKDMLNDTGREANGGVISFLPLMPASLNCKVSA
jgi:hypothetical protein